MNNKLKYIAISVLATSSAYIFVYFAFYQYEDHYEESYHGEHSARDEHYYNEIEYLSETEGSEYGSAHIFDDTGSDESEGVEILIDLGSAPLIDSNAGRKMNSDDEPFEGGDLSSSEYRGKIQMELNEIEDLIELADRKIDGDI